ncbi:MAG: hypothetical protein ACPGN3_13505 [Opitutales bacterium]
MKKNALVLTAALSCAFTSGVYAQTNLLIDAGSFDSGTVSNSSFLDSTLIDDGWQSSRGPGYQITGGVMSLQETRSGLAQVNTISTLGLTTEELASSALNISFDWTESSDTNDPLYFTLIGWRDTTGEGGNDLFRGLNNANPVQIDEDLGGVIFSINTSTIIAEGTQEVGTTVSGTQSYSSDFSLEASLTLSDYDYIGVKFWSVNDNNADGDGFIDNLTLTAVAVPEPSCHFAG